MIFDVVFLLSDEKTADRDKESPVEFTTLPIDGGNLGKMRIIKDPVEDNVTTYYLEFIDLDKDLVSLLKNDDVENIIIRVGRTMTSSVINYDLLKLYIKPIKVMVDKPKKSLLNNVQVHGIGAYNYALMIDKIVSTELENPTSSNTESVSFQRGDGAKTYKSSTKYSKVINVRLNNPGNQRSSGGWVGQQGTQMTSSGSFANFVTPEIGVRAMARDLYNKMTGKATARKVVYANWRGSDLHNGGSKFKTSFVTIKDLVAVWTPVSDNSNKITAQATETIAKLMGKTSSSPLSVSEIPKLIKMMLRQEGGNEASAYYTDEIISNGVAMVRMSEKSILNSPKYRKFLRPNDNTVFSGGEETVDQINNGVTQTEKVYGTTTYLNPRTSKKGIEFLRHVLGIIQNKYGILSDFNASLSGGESTYTYSHIFTPNLSAFELIKHIYEWYPPFYLNSPWIIDDAVYSDSENVPLGSGVFTSVNIFNIDGLTQAPLTILEYLEYITGSELIPAIMTITDRNYFYKDFNLKKLKSTSFNHKCLIDNVDTLVETEFSEHTVFIPDTMNANTSEINTIKKTVDISETENLETNFDASEFKKRLNVLLYHMETSPELVRMVVRVDDLEYFQFGRKYHLVKEETDSKKALTPYKISQTFNNVGGELELEYDILFYQGGTDLTNMT